MIVDTSVLVAIIRNEVEAQRFAMALEKASKSCMSAPNCLETAVVIDGSRNATLSRRLDDVMKDASITIEPVTERQARIAREAYRDYGKGSGHPARLNFGDCCAYALARDLAEPLLFKGTHFSHTDVKSALA